MTDNYDEINEQFKLQAQPLIVETSSESYEPSTNRDIYASVTNNKMIYHPADVAVEENQVDFIFSHIENNIEAQTLIMSKKNS